MVAERGAQAWADENAPGALALGLGRRVAAPRALALHADDALLEVDVGPCQCEGFGDASAAADEQLGQRPVVRCAALEVAVDLAEPQVVEFGVIDRQRCDRKAGVACQ
jgi:hypothetical protein